MKLILGSAQFQNGYGITRENYIIKKKTVDDIFKIAKSQNINLLDIAESYRINNFKYLKKNFKNFEIITKYEVFPKKNIYLNLKKKIKRDLKRYNKNKFYCLHFHKSSSLFNKNSEELILALKKIKNTDNLISKIGVSVYEPDELKNILNIFTPDVVQIPLNIMNQEFTKNKLIENLKKKKIEIHVRSIFLQGLLLDKQNNIKSYKFYKNNKLIKLNKYAKKNNLSLIYLCINYIKQFNISKIIFSCENKVQMREILRNYKKKTNYTINYDQFRCKNLNLIDPRKW